MRLCHTGAAAFALLALPGCATPALVKQFEKSKWEVVSTGPERRPLSLTRGVRTPKGIYYLEVRYSDGALRKVVFDPASNGPVKRWPRATPPEPQRRPLPILSWWEKALPEAGGTPITVEPCGETNKAFPCAQLRGRELWICQGPGLPIPVARFRVWTPTRRREKELSANDVARKIGLALVFPFAVTADVLIFGGAVGAVAAVIWLKAGAPGLKHRDRRNCR